MFSKIALVFTTSLAVAAIAAPTNSGGVSQCNVGTLQCCNSVQKAGDLDKHALGLLGLLGVVLGPVDALVGLTCNPISVIGIGGNSCSGQPVCCTDNKFNGLVSLGCSPINVNL